MIIMSLIAEGIDRVRALELPAGIGSDGNSFGCPRAALVRWRSNWSGKLYQVYVNGEYAGGTFDIRQRQLIVPVPSSFETAVRIEVFAVTPSDACIDHHDELTSNVATGRVKLRLLRSQYLPVDSTIQIYFDNATGVIDYEDAISAEPIAVWPSVYDKAGFGMSNFGQGDFGYDSAGAVGFGLGDFGLGQFGLDADSIEWLSSQLSKGTYKFAVIVTDANGNESIAAETGAIDVIPAATPAEKLSIWQYDKTTNELILSIA